MAGTGPGEVDLAWYLWMDRQFTDVFGAPRLPGFPGEDALVARWEDAVGHEARDLDWYLILAGVRFATTMTRVALRSKADGARARRQRRRTQPPRHAAARAGARPARARADRPERSACTRTGRSSTGPSASPPRPPTSRASSGSGAPCSSTTGRAGTWPCRRRRTGRAPSRRGSSSGRRRAARAGFAVEHLDGAHERLELTPVGRVHMRGAGYTHLERGHGAWHGELDVAGEELVHADVDPWDLTGLAGFVDPPG